MVISFHDGLAAALGSLAHRLARLDRVVLEVYRAYGRVHSAQKEQQVRAAPSAQQALKLLDGQDGVGLGTVVEMVRHFGHVPWHGLAHRDADRLTRRCCGARDPHQTGQREKTNVQLVRKHLLGVIISCKKMNNLAYLCCQHRQTP